MSMCNYDLQNFIFTRVLHPRKDFYGFTKYYVLDFTKKI